MFNNTLDELIIKKYRFVMERCFAFNHAGGYGIVIYAYDNRIGNICFLPEYSYLNMIYVFVSGVFAYCTFILLDKSRLTNEFKALIVNDIKKKLDAVLK